MLFRRDLLFINGEAHRTGQRASASLSRLADRGETKCRTAFDQETGRLLYRWYQAGYIKIGGLP